MYVTQKPHPDRPDVFVAGQRTDQTPESTPAGTPNQTDAEKDPDEAPRSDGEERDQDEYDAYNANEAYEWADTDGESYLIRPSRPVTGRNQPGEMITDTR